MRDEYGVRRYGGHVEAKVSMHVAVLEAEYWQNEGEKNVWVVRRQVTDWEKDDRWTEGRDPERSRP